MISLPDISFPLLQPKNLVEFIGPDPAEQRIVLLLCFEDFGRRLPALRVAVATSDGLTIVRTAHFFRGALGLLQLSIILELSLEIEYRRDSLSEEQWRQSCVQFCELMDRVYLELLEYLTPAKTVG
jgi:hypothetical protein